MHERGRAPVTDKYLVFWTRPSNKTLNRRARAHSSPTPKNLIVNIIITVLGAAEVAHSLTD